MENIFSVFNIVIFRFVKLRGNSRNDCLIFFCKIRLKLLSKMEEIAF